MIKKGIAHTGIFFLYLLSLLPLSFLLFFARLLYYPLYYIIGYRKKVVRKNLLNSFPEKPLPEIIQIEKKFFKFLADLIFEVIKMASISERELKKRFTFTGIELLEQHFTKGESVLACAGHYGNWEWGTLALKLNISAKELVIYKPLHNDAFDNWFYKIRSRFGNTLVAMRRTLRAVTQYKNEASIMLFAHDQTPVKHETQYWVDFLNQPTAAQLGIEKIALQTNRPVYYFQLKALKRGYYRVDCVPLCLDPSKTETHQITDLHFSFLEKMINNDPAYWLWSHKRWKFKPD